MGCWEETDCLTLLPIYPNDPCVMVVMDKSFTYNVNKFHMVLSFQNPADFNHIEAIHHGTYNDYGWLKEVENPKAPDEYRTEKVERPLSQRRVTIFFHKATWEAALAAGMEAAKEWEAREIELTEKIPKTEMVQLKAVAEVAYWTRRDLMICEKFHGCQSHENHYYEVLHKVTNDIWEKQKANDV